MNTILQILLIIIIFSNSIFVMLGKNIIPSKIFQVSWIIALIDILLIYFLFKLDNSVVLYFVFTTIIIISSLGFKTFVNNNSNSLENRNRDINRKKFVNFFVYFMLLFLIMLTIGVMKHLLFDNQSTQTLSL